jgi:branched-chain amino acid transport system ATP-binding protein
MLNTSSVGAVSLPTQVSKVLPLVAGMDHEDIDKIAALVKRISPKYIILMVEHNLSVVANLSDIISVLTRGQVLADGKRRSLQGRAGQGSLSGAGHA